MIVSVPIYIRFAVPIFFSLIIPALFDVVILGRMLKVKSYQKLIFLALILNGVLAALGGAEHYGMPGFIDPYKEYQWSLYINILALAKILFYWKILFPKDLKKVAIGILWSVLFTAFFGLIFWAPIYNVIARYLTP